MMGIYQIRNKENGKVYVGSTRDFEKRKKQHFYALKNNAHHSTKLQRSFNNDGEKFVFEILEEVSDQNELLKREQFWINTKDSFKNGYNALALVDNIHSNSKTIKRKENKELWKALILALARGENFYHFTDSMYFKIISGKHKNAMNLFFLNTVKELESKYIGFHCQIDTHKMSWIRVLIYDENKKYFKTWNYDGYGKNCMHDEEYEVHYSEMVCRYTPKQFTEDLVSI
jgi:group I intron endonuclease